MYRKDLTVALGSYASVLFRVGQADQAIAIGSDSIQFCEGLFDLQPDIYRDDLAERHYQQALYVAETEDFDTACEHGETAVQHRRCELHCHLKKEHPCSWLMLQLRLISRAIFAPTRRTQIWPCPIFD